MIEISMKIYLGIETNIDLVQITTLSFHFILKFLLLVRSLHLTLSLPSRDQFASLVNQTVLRL